jgi:hypothetical protein
VVDHDSTTADGAEDTSGSNVFRIGALAEVVNLAGLAVLNFAGPAALGTAPFGLYSRSVGVTFLVLGVIDSPLALSLITRPSETLTVTLLKKSTLSIVMTIVLGAVALDEPSAIVASIALTLAHSVGTSIVGLAYRKQRPGIVAFWFATATTVLLMCLVLGGRNGWSPPLIIYVQSGILLILASSVLAHVLGMQEPIRHRVSEVRSTALGLASYLSGPLQWLLVLLVGKWLGNVEAAHVKVGTVLISLPLAAVPLSGPLLLATASMSGQEFRLRTRLAFVSAGGSVVATAALILRDWIFDVLQLHRGQTLMEIMPMLLLAGVGLAILSTSWPSLAAQLLPSNVTKRVMAGAAIAVGVLAGAPLWGTRATLMGLSTFYIVGGLLCLLFASKYEASSPPHGSTENTPVEGDA